MYVVAFFNCTLLNRKPDPLTSIYVHICIHIHKCMVSLFQLYLTKQQTRSAHVSPTEIITKICIIKFQGHAAPLEATRDSPNKKLPFYVIHRAKVKILKNKQCMRIYVNIYIYIYIYIFIYIYINTHTYM